MPRSPESLRTVELGQNAEMFRLEMDRKAFWTFTGLPSVSIFIFIGVVTDRLLI